MGTTDTLTKYFNEQINVDSLFEDLEMTSPYYTNYSTDDTSVAFMGTFDENFDVYFDGEKLSLNEAGNFYFEKQLEVGMNTFVITHKGKTIYYNIERTINVLKSIGSSVAEGKTLKVDGGMAVSVLAVAYKGSYATATLGGTTIELTENAKSDVVDINSSYAAFTGKIVVPEGIVDEEQYLGNVEISASYAGYSRTYIGAEVIVNAVKLPDKNIEIIDGLPKIITYGISNGEFKEMSNLFKSWAYIKNIDNKVPYYTLRASTKDSAEVSDVEGGYYLSLIHI